MGPEEAEPVFEYETFTNEITISALEARIHLRLQGGWRYVGTGRDAETESNFQLWRRGGADALASELIRRIALTPRAPEGGLLWGPRRPYCRHRS
jgi:hypothetical protein